jgi:hypothetical protein
VPIVLKFGSLNLLEPSGSVKACNGIDLPFLLPLSCLKHFVTVLRPGINCTDYKATKHVCMSVNGGLKNLGFSSCEKTRGAAINASGTHDAICKTG